MSAHDLRIPHANRWAVALLTAGVALTAQADPLPTQAPAGTTAVQTATDAAPIEGRVERLLVNPFGEVDGLVMSDGRVVKFPPHQGKALAQVAAPGQNVRVTGEVKRGGEIKAERVVNSASGAQVLRQERPWWPPERPRWLRERQLTSLQTEGRVARVVNGKRGEVKRVILDNGTVVQLPKHSLMPQPLQPGKPFAAAGRGTRGPQGTGLLASRVGPTLAALQPLTQTEH